MKMRYINALPLPLPLDPHKSQLFQPEVVADIFSFVLIKDSMYNFHGFRVQSSAYYFAPIVEFYFSTIERGIFCIRIKNERASRLS